MNLERTLAGLAEEWARPETSIPDKLLRIAQRGAQTAGLAPTIGIGRCVIVELTEAPRPMRGFSDLEVRRAAAADVPQMCRLDNADPALYRARLDRGDMAYVGLVDGEVLCQTWFHRGPTSFDEERSSFVRWALDPASCWSYDAMTRADARASGVFVKLFQHALREVLALPGVRRIQGFIHHANEPSLKMHQRLRFSVLGTLTTLAIPGLKWVHWSGGGVTRQWLVRREGDLSLRFPV
jgi:hypothetical protein